MKNAIKYCCAIMILVIVSLNTTNADAKTYNVNYAKTISLYEGKSIQLKWKGKSSKVKGYSSDGFVAVVNQSGKVKLKNAGKVWIKAAKVIAGKTVLMIAHRLSTITDADKIVVIKDGQIIDEGTHENLLTSCTLYQEMWKAHMDTKDVA